MDPLQSGQLVLFFFALVEGIPVKLHGYGLGFTENLMICLVIVIVKLTLEVALIRGVSHGLWNLWLKNLFQRHNILMINQWYFGNKKKRKIDISSQIFGRLEIVHSRPVEAMSKVRGRLIKWALGTEYVGLFVLGVAPFPPIIAAAGLMTYILLTSKQPWYRFNNLKFICLLAGLEVKVIVVVLLIYKIF